MNYRFGHLTSRIHCPKCGRSSEAKAVRIANSSHYPLFECQHCHAVVRTNPVKFAFWISWPLMILGGFSAIFIHPVAILVVILASVLLYISQKARPSRIIAEKSECRKCGYDLRSRLGNKCPECGQPVPEYLNNSDSRP